MIPVPSRDRGGTPFEITLELRRNGDSFGAVGERCGFFLAGLARRLRTARADGSPQATAWPDPEDRFPEPPERLCREPELFAFRYRERGDLVSTGELRCALRTSSLWVAGQQENDDRRRGCWRVARRAILEAWGAGGRGVRVVLTSGELSRFLGELLEEAALAGANYGDLVSGTVSSRTRR